MAHCCHLFLSAMLDRTMDSVLFFGQPVVKAYVSGAIKLDAKVGQRTCIYTPYIGSRAVQKNMFCRHMRAILGFRQSSDT